MGEGRSSGGNPCRWQCPRPPKGPASWVSRQCLVGQEMVAQRWREVCLRYCGPGLCPPGRSWGNLPGKSWGGDLCSFLGLSFHISKMGAK